MIFKERFMYKRVFLLFALLLLSTQLMADSTKEIAFVKNINGKVTAQKESSKVVRELSQGDKIYSKDTIITSKNSGVNISFNDGSSLTLGESSILNIQNYLFEPLKKDFDFQLRVKKGTALFESGKIGKLAPNKFKMHIPNSVIGIRGTKFLVKVE